MSQRLKMPWFCYTGFNILVLWNMVTFSLDSTQVFGLGAALTITSMQWVVFVAAQALTMGIYACAADRIQDRFARSEMPPALSWIAAALTAAGALGMLQPVPAISLIASACAACGSGWLWLMWARFFGCLGSERAERIIVRSVALCAGVACACVALPPTIRFFLAQLIPFFSVICSVKALRWAHDHAENLSSDEARLAAVEEAPTPTARMVFGLLLPSLLVFFLIPFATMRVGASGPVAAALAFIFAFALAALLTYLFLQVTPSITLSFIFRWQVPLIALGVVLYAMGFAPISAWAVLSTALIVISEFTWIYLCRLMRLYPARSLRMFMGGYFTFDLGEFLGSLLAAALVPALASGAVDFGGIGYAVLLMIVVALAVMVYVPQQLPASASQPHASAALSESADVSSADTDADEKFYERFKITPREREIIGYLARGRSVPFIRDELFISQNTVNTHIKHIYAKTAVNSRQELLDMMEAFRS